MPMKILPAAHCFADPVIIESKACFIDTAACFLRTFLCDVKVAVEDNLHCIQFIPFWPVGVLHQICSNLNTFSSWWLDEQLKCYWPWREEGFSHHQRQDIVMALPSCCLDEKVKRSTTRDLHAVITD